MAFCNSCGTSLAPGARFCNKCGATVAASATAPATTPATPIPSTGAAPMPTTQGSSAVKIILIVVAVIVVLGILGMGTVGFVAWRIARSTHLRHQGDAVKVETPFGTIASSKDPEEAARNLGIDIYPGAQLLNEGAGMATLGGVRTVMANFETSDSVDKVAAFYRSKFPNAMVNTSQEGSATIVSSDSRNLVTININASGDKTKIHISNVNHKSTAANSSSN